MVAKFICFFSYLLIAYAFFAKGFGGKDRTDPINYFGMDENLKDKINDLKNYNAEMLRMFNFWALSWIVVGALFFPLPMLAGLIIVLIAGCVGSVVTYKVYKNILRKYS